MIHYDKVTKVYNGGQHAVEDITLSVESGEFVFIVGHSGAGKTTLLNLIGCLDKPTSGTLTVAGADVTGLNRKESASFRGSTIGFIFQDFNLVPILTVYENVEYPLLMVRNVPSAERKRLVNELLEAVGMTDQSSKFPDQISGGQKQRAAIARALVTQPACVLADEPTGNLDRSTAHGVFDLMLELARTQGTAFIVVTHDEALAARCARQLRLVQGKLAEAVSA